MIARWVTHTAGDIEDQHQIRVLHLSRLACIGNSIGNGGIIADHNLQVTRATVATGIRSRHDETRTIRCITVALNVVSQHIVFERVGIIHRVDTGCGAADTGYRQHSFRIVDQGLTAATGQVVSLPTDGQGSQIFPLGVDGEAAIEYLRITTGSRPLRQSLLINRRIADGQYRDTGILSNIDCQCCRIRITIAIFERVGKYLRGPHGNRCRRERITVFAIQPHGQRPIQPGHGESTGRITV